jgi:2-desacetyl-2-hydroxyethyl bacteriochlorophyllide A dehydrogenase
MMLAIVKEKIGKGWVLRDVPKPAPSRGEVLVRVKRIGICGSDLAIYDGREKDIRVPVIPGHEFAGEVVEKGPEVADVDLGSRVAVNLVNNCGHCHYCRRGYPNLCLHTNLIGFHTNGGFAEYVVVPSQRCHVIPDPMTWDAAASIEPVTSALAALKKSGVRSSDFVAIIGPGPIGLYACQIAKLEGARKVFVLGTRQSRLDVATQLGAQKTILVNREDPFLSLQEVLAETDGKGVDVVLEASGSSSSVRLALKIAAKRARVVLLSIFHDSSSFEPMDIVFKQLKLYGSFDYEWIDFEQGRDLIADGRVRTEPLITHRYPLQSIEEGIRVMEEKKAIKVMIEP